MLPGEDIHHRPCVIIPMLSGLAASIACAFVRFSQLQTLGSCFKIAFFDHTFMPDDCQLDKLISIRRSYGPFLFHCALIDQITRQIGWRLTQTVIGFGEGLDSGSRVLDAGAGQCNMAIAFDHCDYHACDVESVSESYLADPFASQFACSLAEIPRPTASFDGIVCSQVLEHIDQPQQAMDELARVLRPGGSLLLTTNGVYGVHQPPFHFYNTTPFSLLQLFTRAGLEVTHLVPRGGYFQMVGGTLPTVVDQMLLGPRASILRKVLMPLTHGMIPAICMALDRVDQRQGFAESWDVIARKPGRAASAFDDSHLPKYMQNRRYHPDVLQSQYPQLTTMMDAWRQASCPAA